MLSTVDKVEILKMVPLFAGLETRDLLLISLVTSEEEFSAQEILFEQGEQGDELFVLASGVLEVLKSEDKKEPCMVAEIKEGQCVAELALFADAPRTATLRAKESSVLLILSGLILHELMLEHPRLGLGMIRTLVRRYS